MTHRIRSCALGLTALTASMHACSSGDSTEFDLPEESVESDGHGVESPSGPVNPELATLRAENAEAIERLLREGEALYGHWSDAEVEVALAGVPLPDPGALAAEREALRAAPLSDAEADGVRAILEARGVPPEEISFHGRIVMQGDLIHLADELYSSLTAQDKAVMGILTNSEPFPGPNDPPVAPDVWARSLNGEAQFLRPDTTRQYYVVLPDGAPEWIMDALLQATNDLEAAQTSDCVGGGLFTPIRESDYSAIHPITRSLGSAISVRYSDSACAGRAGGCANSPRAATLVISPNVSSFRMRLGTYLGLESDYDDDEDGVPDVNSSTARNILLHELSHILGFDHPRYSNLEAEPDTTVVRVPQTAQGTVPTIMLPTSFPLFSPVVSVEDQRALVKAYGGDCAYSAQWRTLGKVCSQASEEVCLRHGASCEKSSSDLERCRWHNFTDQQSCGRFSHGLWETSNAEPETLLPGAAGACLIAVSSLPACVNESMHREPADYAGRCCTQFTKSGGQPKPGIFVNGFSDAFSSWYFCSDQRGLPEDVAPSWQFSDPAEQGDFTPLDPVTLASVPGWQVSSGNYTQWQNRPEHLTISDARIEHGCLMTRVTTTDNDESGIVFNYRDNENYYVYDAVPNQRRRIRQVASGVSTTLASTSWSGQATWSPGITLTVCFGNGIHAFVGNDRNTRLSSNQVVDYVGTGGRIGLWNRYNQAARHSYLSSYTLADGYAYIQ